ncbi:MAG: PucR family transcriptional regulator [Acidimicrobiales bacterium]
MGGSDPASETRSQPPSRLLQLAERHTDRIARQIVATLCAEVPFYAELPRERLDADVRGVVVENLSAFLRMVNSDGAAKEFDQETTAALHAGVVRRVEERVPLDALLRAYSVGFRVVWEFLVQVAEPNEHTELLAAVSMGITYIDRVTALVSEAYVTESEAFQADEYDLHHALGQALLAGEPCEELASRSGYDLANDYVVVAIHRGIQARYQTLATIPMTSRTPRWRWIRNHIEDAFGVAPLVILDGETIMVLLPGTVEMVRGHIAHLPQATDALAATTRLALIAGFAYNPGRRGVPISAEQARRVLRLTRRLQRPPGAYGIDDVIFEYAISRDVEATTRMAGLLAPLARSTKRELLETLTTYFESDFDRRAAAARLHVHPNTIDYRLGKIRSFTGLDPASARGHRLLEAAIVAHRLSEEPLTPPDPA